MGKQLVPINGSLPDSIHLGNNFLRIPPGLDQKSWITVANKLTNVSRGFSWWVGDLAAHAIQYYENPEELLKQLADALDFKMMTIKHYAWLAKKFSIRDRVVGAGIHHHMIVAHLPRVKRQAILRKAVDKSWPARILEHHVVPKEKRLTSVILRVPLNYTTNNRFILDLKDFCKTWNIKRYRFWGAVRYTPKTTKARIQVQASA